MSKKERKLLHEKATEKQKNSENKEKGTDRFKALVKTLKELRELLEELEND